MSYLDRIALNERMRRRRLRYWLKRRGLRRARRISRLSTPSVSKLLPYVQKRFLGKNQAKLQKSDHTVRIEFPRVFCLIENPVESLNAIYSVLEASFSDEAKSVYLDQSKCQEIGISASAILDVIALEIRDEWRARRAKRAFAGRLPSDQKAKHTIECMGITRHLRVRGHALPPEVEQQFTRFDLFQGARARGGGLRRTTDQERVASRLVNYLDTCLRIAGKVQLSVEGRRQILKWIGEIITNAEDHCGMPSWYAIGYMVPCLPAGSTGLQDFVGECQLAIFNFGRTIFQSLHDPNTPKGTLTQIDTLAQQHSERKFFESLKYEPEDLWTLYALQDGVSRFALRPGELTRGKGTVEMIEAFQALGMSKQSGLQPKMSIISGSSFILFDGKYHMAAKDVRGGRRMIIAFNENNALEEKPNSDNVRTIKPVEFPGTILSYRFYIDSQHLAAITNNPHE